MNLFPEWYVGRHLGKTLVPEQQRSLREVCTLLCRSALAQPQVYVHRDFIVRNLMLTSGRPGVLDFQDALYGPISYDLVSLLRDAANEVHLAMLRLKDHPGVATDHAQRAKACLDGWNDSDYGRALLLALIFNVVAPPIFSMAFSPVQANPLAGRDEPARALLKIGFMKLPE